MRAQFDEQIGWAKEEGVDLIIGETFEYLAEAQIALEAIQAAGLPSLDARRVIARLEQLKAPSKSLEHSFPPLSNGKAAPPVKEEAGWSQVAKPVVPEAVVPEALPEEPPVIIEAPAPAPR